MRAAAYPLKLDNKLLRHSSLPVVLLQDSGPDDMFALEARVRSGDYFETLATRLDQVIEHEMLNPGRGSLREALNDVIDELMYLQQRYALVKK